MTTREVCALARVSVRTFWKRKKAGDYDIQPCDRGAELLWKREDVLRVLDMAHDDPPAAPAEPTWKVDRDALREARARRLRRKRAEPPIG